MHPILSYYKNTINRKCDLILFVGREPNSDEDLSDTSGEYNFDCAHRCGFWNIAYGVMGEVFYDGLSTKCMKNMFREQKYSEIVFADSLPTTIKYKTKDKDMRRKKISEDDKICHVRNISKLKIFKRVKVIVLCGLEKEIYSVSVDEFKKIATQNNIKIIETKFLSGYKKKDIVKDLKKEKEDIRRRLY